MTDKPLSIAVVGTGIGLQHLDALAAIPEEYHIAVVCDIDESRAIEVAEKYGARPEVSLEKVLADPAIDVVDLCTPPRAHEEQILQTLAAGQHVVCEKPLVGSLAAIDRVAEAAEAAGRFVFPVFNYRFGPSYQQFLQVVEDGSLGKALVATVEVGFRRGPDYYVNPWRGTIAGELGGCLTAHAIHHFDMLLAALGDATSVNARTATRVNDIETEDCAVGTIEFGSGAFASFAVTLGCVEEYSRLRMVFEGGVVEFGPGPYGSISEGDWTIVGIDDLPDRGRDEPGFERMFREMGQAIVGADNVAPTVAQARNTIELLTAFYQASTSDSVAALPVDSEDEWYGQWRN